MLLRQLILYHFKLLLYSHETDFVDTELHCRPKLCNVIHKTQYNLNINVTSSVSYGKFKACVGFCTLQIKQTQSVIVF